MAGRPAKAPTQRQREDIQRERARGLGRERIAARLGIGERMVRGVLDSMPRTRKPSHELAWERFPRQDAYLREHVGEQGVRRLAREVSRLGPARSRGAVELRLTHLGLAGFEAAEDGHKRHTLPDMRMDLTVRQVMELTGRDRTTVMGWIDRKALAARMEDGAYRIHPSKLLDCIDADPERVEPRRVGLWASLWALAREQWGVTEETERRRRRRAA
jgi:hypothetical protein